MSSRTNDSHQIRPVVRRNPEDIVVQEVYDELVIYDLKSNEAHSLNSTAAKIWQWSDGEFTTDMMADQLADQFDISKEQAESLVWLSLDRFEKAKLLQSDVHPPATYLGLTRRQVLKGIAVAAIVPVVYSITAPYASAQGTYPPVDPTQCIKKSEYDKDPTLCAPYDLLGDVGVCFDNAGCGKGGEIAGYVTCTDCLTIYGPAGQSGTSSWAPFVSQP